MTRRDAARALRDTLRELTATTAAATKFANHAMGLALTFRHDLVPSTSITREAKLTGESSCARIQTNSRASRASPNPRSPWTPIPTSFVNQMAWPFTIYSGEERVPMSAR